MKYHFNLKEIMRNESHTCNKLSQYTVQTPHPVCQLATVPQRHKNNDLHN